MKLLADFLDWIGRKIARLAQVFTDVSDGVERGRKRKGRRK